MLLMKNRLKTEIYGFRCNFFSARLVTQIVSYLVSIAGIPCRGGWFRIIGLHENGRVSECTLAEAIDIDGNLQKRPENQADVWWDCDRKIQ
jgi:hypothetical protein